MSRPYNLVTAAFWRYTFSGIMTAAQRKIRPQASLLRHAHIAPLEIIT